MKPAYIADAIVTDRITFSDPRDRSVEISGTVTAMDNFVVSS